jgi:hypothetical protein
MTTHTRLPRLLLLAASAVFLSGCTLANIFGGKTPDQLELGDVTRFINTSIKLLASFGFLATLFTMVAGYQFLMSAGNEEGMNRAKDTIRYAALGMLFVVGAYAVVRVIFELLAPNAVPAVFTPL